jgi:hypothetical protein
VNLKIVSGPREFEEKEIDERNDEPGVTMTTEDESGACVWEALASAPAEVSLTRGSDEAMVYEKKRGKWEQHVAYSARVPVDAGLNRVLNAVSETLRPHLEQVAANINNPKSAHPVRDTKKRK